MRYVCLLVLIASTLHAQDGAAIYRQKCASCHDTPAARVPAQSAAVTVIPGVVFSASVDGHLRAYSTATGKILWDTDTARDFLTVNGTTAHGGSLDASGASVVNGVIFVNSGYGQWGGMPGNVLLAFSIH
jgi:polyvinyl alcohol dehydrogenase (cytochrome)